MYESSNILNEASLPKSDVREIHKVAPWIKTTDDMGKSNIDYWANKFIDLSAYADMSPAAYMRKVIDVSTAKHEDNQMSFMVIPVNDWSNGANSKVWNPAYHKNPISALYAMMQANELATKFPHFTFIFVNDEGYFKVSTDDFNKSDIQKYAKTIDKMTSKNTSSARGVVGKVPDKTEPIIIPGSISSSQVPKEEVSNKKKPDPVLTVVDKSAATHQKEKDDAALVNAVKKAVDKATSEEDAVSQLDLDKEFVSTLNNYVDDYAPVNLSAARQSRMTANQQKLMDSNINGKSVKEMIDKPSIKELPASSLKVNSINDDWKDMKFMNFEKSYNIDADIASILNSFSKMSYPVSVLSVSVEDTSTSEDYIDTYTVNCEDYKGQRFTLKFDIPKLINNRFMKLRGNDKVTSGQLLLLPCIKTDLDTVQIVSNYNKIFIRRYGMIGRSLSITDRLLKTLSKLDKNDKEIILTAGDNTKICAKYELPIDYIDIASKYSRIKTPEYEFMFDQDYIRANYPVDLTEGIPVGIKNDDHSIIYFKRNFSNTFSAVVTWACKADKKFNEIYLATKPAPKCMYSQASILGFKIPLVVVLGYNIGLSRLLKKAGYETHFSDKKPNLRDEVNFDTDCIQFKDGYLIFSEGNYETSMMLNGLKECDTASYSYAQMDSRAVWIDFLEAICGTRTVVDGLDNFADLMMDPITQEVCRDYKIPDQYIDILIYGNDLLTDNKYNKHTDISGNRYRSTEQIAGYLYGVLANAYKDYRRMAKQGKAKPRMSVKQSAVIDAILTSNITSDLSILSPVLEIESSSATTFKGLSGMNTERAYGLDKRTYDKSMVNKLGLSTGFAANVGISRQATMDMDIEGTRGYIKNTKEPEKDMSVAKTFCATEAITPFGTTRDDPFRSAMTYVQTAKHSMRTETSAPLLITNGADEALPYLISNNFAFKARQDGKVLDLDKDHMILEYKDGTNDFVDLKKNVKKNSDGGFYVTLKLDTDLKLNSRFKAGDVVAYDRQSFSKDYGEDNNLSYDVGVLAKVAIAATDEGFEDSTIISEWMSDAMASDVVTMKDITLAKNANIYKIADIGQKIQEGDPLIIYQNAFDEEDANMLLKVLTNEDEVSELGHRTIRSHYTGEIQDIKIYRTCKTEECSDSIKKLIKAYDALIDRKRKMYKKYNIDGANRLDPDYPLPATGKLKNVDDGILIEFYIKYYDKMAVGDKNVAQSACKGVVKDIFPAGKEPWSEYRPEEKIHGMYSARSFNARMITSVLISGAINKAMIELDRHVKDIMGIPIKYLEDIEKVEHHD